MSKTFRRDDPRHPKNRKHQGHIGPVGNRLAAAPERYNGFGLVRRLDEDTAQKIRFALVELRKDIPGLVIRGYDDKEEPAQLTILGRNNTKRLQNNHVFSYSDLSEGIFSALPQIHGPIRATPVNLGKFGSQRPSLPIPIGLTLDEEATKTLRQQAIAVSKVVCEIADCQLKEVGNSGYPHISIAKIPSDTPTDKLGELKKRVLDCISSSTVTLLGATAV